MQDITQAIYAQILIVKFENVLEGQIICAAVAELLWKNGKFQPFTSIFHFHFYIKFIQFSTNC